MRNVLKKNKPTKASYFQSESDRKKSNRLAFIYGSKPLVAVLSVLVLSSLAGGVAIIQKQNASKAATIQSNSVSWNMADANTNIARWQATGTPGFDQYAEVSKTDRLIMSLKSGPQYPDGYQVCWSMVPGGVGGAQNFRYTSAEFAYETNEAGANGVLIAVDGQNLPILNAASTHQGGNNFVQRVTVDFANLPGGSMQLGQTIKFCNFKLGAGKLLAKKTVSIFAYSFRASYDTVTADPTLAYEIVSKTLPPSTMTNGSTATVSYKLRNTGTTTWQNNTSGASNPVYLGTSNAANTEVADGHNRLSLFSNVGDGNWIGKNRIKLQEASVPQGGIGTFTFTIVARASSANATETRTEYFDLVQEGIAWFPSKGINFTVKVIPKVSSPPPAQPATPVVLERCSNTGSGKVDSVEAEQALCTADIVVGADGAASNGKGAILDKTGQVVEYTFTAPKAGYYNAVSRMRNQTSAQGTVSFEFVKLNPGASSDLLREAAKPVSGGTSYTNYTPKGSDGKPVEHLLKAGQQAIIKVRQSADANVVVDQLTMNFAREEAAPPSAPATPAFARCANTGSGKVDSVEAEAALCSDTVAVNDDGTASAGKAAFLEKSGQTVEYTFTAPKVGFYEAVAKMRNQTSAKGEVSFEFIRLNPGASSDLLREAAKPVSGGTSYTNYTPKSDSKPIQQYLVAGQQAMIRIRSSGDPNILVDQLIMNFAGTTSNRAGPITTPAPATSPVTPTAPSSCSQIGAVEAENAIPKNSTGVATDPLHQDVKAAVLFSTDSAVECTLKAPKDGRYALGARVRSADFKGVAELKISMANGSDVASRTLNAPKDQAYGLVRFNEVADYRELKKDQPVVVRVTFTNDARDGNGGDRNLWVDNMVLVEIPPAAAGTGGGNQNNDSGSAIVPCLKEQRTEAEQASVYKGALIQSDNSASGNSMVRLNNNNAYIQCTLKAPEAGKYVLGATVKSDNLPLQDRAIARLSMSGNNKGVQEDNQPSSGKYDRVRMRANTETTRNMTAGEIVVVRVEATNASSNVLTKKHLLVDSIELVKLPNSPPPSQATPANPATDAFSIPVSEEQPGTEEVSYNIATGSVYIKAEAETSGYQGTAFDELPAQGAIGNKAVRLWSNKNYVEYTFDFPATDMYGLDFAARSENYKNKTADARIVLDGKKLFGDDISLKSTAVHTYYTSEKKVQITKGRHTFKVEFVNDARGPDGDRNLIIDFLRIRGSKRLVPVSTPATPNAPSTPVFENLDPNTQVIEAEAASYCQATNKRIGCEQLAIPDGTAYGGRALVLNKKGDFVEAEFTVQTAGKYSAGATLRSMDFLGSAKADIYIDGDKVGGGVTPSSEAFRPTFMYQKTFKANSKHKVKIVFINDLCGKSPTPCNISNDRNMLVDQLRMTLISATGAPAPGPVTSTSGYPRWAQSTKNNVLATDWACTPPPLSEYGAFYCPDSNKPENQKRKGVILFNYPANGGRTAQAMLYVPLKMIQQMEAGKPVTPLPLVFYLHGRGSANIINNNTEVSPLGINIPPSIRKGYWNDAESSGKLNASYNTANDTKYGGVIVIAPSGQGRVIDGRDWGWPANITDLANLPKYIEEMFPYLNVDESRIYTMGSSMGGHDSLQFVTLKPNVISAAYSNDGVSDWALRYQQVAGTPTEPSSLANNPLGVADLKLTIPIETGGTPQTNLQAYKIRSPLVHLDAVSAKRPIKIEVDMQDSLVSPTQSLIFYDKYKSLNPNAPAIRKNPSSGHSAGLPPHGEYRAGSDKLIYASPMEFFFNGGSWFRK